MKFQPLTLRPSAVPNCLVIMSGLPFSEWSAELAADKLHSGWFWAMHWLEKCKSDVNT